MPAVDAVRAAVEFRIDAVPPSLNRLLRNRGLRIREPAKWHLLVKNAARGILPFMTPVRIALTFHAGTPGRTVDPDNHAKTIMDSIVHTGLIQDDRWPFVAELVLRARPLAKGKQAFTLVRIEPVMGEGLG